jgi:beta-lactamase regulating signal transducer with metallopeptidase domain
MPATLNIWLQLLGLLAAETAVIIALCAQVARLTRSAIWRRTIWQACVLGVALLAAVELTGSARSLIGWTKGNQQVRNSFNDSYTDVKASELKKTAAPLSNPPPSQGEGEKLTTSVSAPPYSTFPDSAQPDPMAMAAAPRSDAARHISSSIPRAQEPANDPLPLLCLGLVWMTGASVVLGRVLFSRIAFGMLWWKRRQVADAGLLNSAEKLAKLLNIRRRVRLLESPRFSGPIAFGIFKPMIGLPAGFAVKFNLAQRETMLAHELAHLAARDPAWYLLADLLAGALWWHPLVWWSRARMHAESELAADEASLLVANGPAVLAECLVELGARLARPRAFGWLGVAGNGFRSGLGRRVERLVNLDGDSWRPPRRVHCGAAKILGPLMLAAIAILCIAWAAPEALTKGNNMKTMQQTWKRSAAAFALMAALGSDNPTASADGVATLASVPTAPPTLANNTAPTQPAAQSDNAARQAFARRYGLPATPPATASVIDPATGLPIAAEVPESPEHGAIRSRLETIILDKVQFDGLPLDQVIKILVDQSASRDADKQGMNFMVNRETPPASSATIDPTTGLPAAVEAPDLAQVTIKIDPPLKHIRLIDALEAITKTADRPIKYSIEDYGVLFSFDWEKVGNFPRPQPAALPPQFHVTTYRVNTTNDFLNSLLRTFHKSFNNALAQREQVSFALDEITKELGAKNKLRIIYNEQTGVIMARGTEDDLQILEAVITTLGGSPMSNAANQTFSQRLEAITRAASTNPSKP